MQIFVLDKDPKVCASYHMDKHVCKGILETAQLLCNAHWAVDSPAPYQNTHFNHMCSKWARKSIGNYRWLVQLGLELCDEYERRYDRTHATRQIIEWCRDNEPLVPQGRRTKFAICIPDMYNYKNPVMAYRSYYMASKRHLAKWKNGKPDWYM